jgi:hypothetical protein
VPCLFVVFALLTPRLVVALLWLFSRWFDGMIATILWYSAVQHWFAGQWSLWPVVGLVIALLVDLSPAKGGRRRTRPVE